MSNISKNVRFNSDEERFKYLCDKFFYQGWNHLGNINYIYKGTDEYEKYQKIYEFDCVDMVCGVIKSIREFCNRDETEISVYESWIDELCSRAPTDDKELDYFLTHNTAYGLLMCWLYNSASKGLKDRIDENEIIKEQCMMEMLMQVEEEHKKQVRRIETLKDMNAPIEDLANKVVDDMDTYIEKEKNPKIYRAKRNQEIIDKYDARRHESNKPNIYKEIADDYLDISHHMVKKIVQLPTSTPTRIKKSISTKQ